MSPSQGLICNFKGLECFLTFCGIIDFWESDATILNVILGDSRTPRLRIPAW